LYKFFFTHFCDSGQGGGLRYMPALPHYNRAQRGDSDTMKVPLELAVVNMLCIR